MHPKTSWLALAAATLAFAALPVAAQNHGSHGGAGGSHSGAHISIGSSGSGHPGGGHGGGDGHGDGGHGGNNGHGGHDNGHHSHNNNGYGYGYGYGAGYGYAWGTPAEMPYDSEYDQLEGRGTLDHPQAQEQPDNRVGPTIFEHNGQPSNVMADSRNGAPEYRPQPTYDEPATASAELLTPTVLVFRDGHQQEVANYAIAGTHLIVLDGKSQKILLTDLDVSATSKANADRGVDFKVPQS